jgi:hypothetical protein
MSLSSGIRKRITRLDLKTRQLFTLLYAQNPAQLVAIPRPDAWSALMAVNHIYLGEQLSLQYVQHKLRAPDSIPGKGPDAWFRTLVLKWVLMSPLKFRSPAPINMRNEQPLLGLQDLETAWAAQRASMTRLLEEYESRMRNRIPYKHPYAGRLTLGQMLIFFEDHQDHHHRQIKSILKEVSK